MEGLLNVFTARKKPTGRPRKEQGHTRGGGGADSEPGKRSTEGNLVCTREIGLLLGEDESIPKPGDHRADNLLGPCTGWFCAST